MFLGIFGLFGRMGDDGRIEIVNHDNLDAVLTELRETGITAIMTMQSAIGVYETHDTAARGWDSMCSHQRAQTLLAYGLLTSSGDHVLLDPRITGGHLERQTNPFRRDWTH